MYRNTCGQMTVSQRAIRKVFCNPMLVILGILYSLLSVLLLVDLIDYLFIGSMLKDSDAGSGNIWLTLMGILFVVYCFGAPIFMAAACFTLRSNAKSNPRKPMKNTGSSILLAGAIMQSVCWLAFTVVFCIVISFMVMQFGKFSFEGVAIIATLVCIPLFYAVYSVCFIGFAESVRMNVVKDKVITKFSIATAVTNIIFAIGTLFVYVMSQASALGAVEDASIADMSLINGYSVPLLIVINLLMAIYVLWYRSVLKKCAQEVKFENK